jgi:transglutaminase-like putative cysteine protease
MSGPMYRVAATGINLIITGENHMKFALALFLTVLSFCGTANAAAGDPLDLQIRFNRYHQNFLINADGTATESTEWSKKILKETALEGTKRASIGYSTSAEKAKVILAYTLKANGRRINVPKDNYQLEVNSGKDKDSPVYSDRSTLTVIFPDVAVGDSVVFAYKITQTEPIFPKHYSTSQVFFNAVAFDDVRVKFDYPASLWVQYEARGMKQIENSTKGNRKIVEWHYANPHPVKTERRDYTVFDSDKETGYAFSTFKSYADIAAAYGMRAIPKAAVTDRIVKLAAEIVKDRTGDKDQARALYDWVATNITYAGNCVGIGAVVPRDIAFILDNKMGDCKDHATLLQALLAARGIKSTQALVNSGPSYQLQKIPVVSTVNHVINYLPAFDLYVDSTSSSTPFGMLPFGDQDKPVLLVEDFKPDTKTPVPPIDSDRLKVTSLVSLTSDGSVSGSVEVFQNGVTAADSRVWAREITKDVENDLVKNIFRQKGLVGSGKIEKDDPTELSNVYHYKISFDGEKFLKFPGTGAFYVYPPMGIGSSIYDSMRSSTEVEKEVDVTCTGGTISEDYVFELPQSMKVLSIPDDMNISSDVLQYTATYQLDSNVLKVKRTLEDRTKGNVCSPQEMANYKKVADKVLDNLKEQVLYK